MTQVRFYFDDDSSDGDVVRARRKSGIDATTSLGAGMEGKLGAEHLAHATSESRVVVTANTSDFAQLHVEWLREGRSHAGILIVHQQRYSVGEKSGRLERFALERSAERMHDWIECLSAFSS